MLSWGSEHLLQLLPHFFLQVPVMPLSLANGSSFFSLLSDDRQVNQRILAYQTRHF